MIPFTTSSIIKHHQLRLRTRSLFQIPSRNEGLETYKTDALKTQAPLWHLIFFLISGPYPACVGVYSIHYPRRIAPPLEDRSPRRWRCSGNVSSAGPLGSTNAFIAFVAFLECRVCGSIVLLVRKSSGRCLGFYESQVIA
ncbi:hypothetical protein K439DRAFT_749977 [Ramaria rubella]|nr:hypothetical protein K439DRAFT_749977 [Ramaria rubella]